jgi:Domain of unknown function (DUF4430)
VALLNLKKLLALGGASLVLAAVLAVPAGAALAASGPAVTVQIKSLTKTLLKPTKVHGGTGWITKGHTPSGKCSARSAAGALNNATHGRWTATYYAGVGGIFVDSILGVKPPNKNDYWEILVNGRASSLGACQIKLKTGEKLLFKLTKG